ncbi:30S ribosomal protein S3 [Candidatus Gracilibacteria bacterium]|nr:30S ribosomal protein S3 [Candidatus Gracilibacteria bacterium]MCF7856619.1 30S ribosomal protein S3 [Candidatus Gracilibacteria bacterium]MCF7896919.1 30S ribosomal protein S3 [Candidatus Gracilibacteria bacterium]
MGQKVNPKSFRLGGIKSWSSRWFSKKNYANLLHRDITLRKAIKERLKESGIGEIEIERSSGSVKVNVFSSKPGMVIGRQGIALEELKKDIEMQFGDKIEINIVEVAKPDSVAQLIAENVANQIERRMPFRRVAKQAVKKGMESGLRGIKVRVAGRLNGADISREETFKEGNIPLHTIRADVDYGEIPAKTTYGKIGVKVWTYRGEVFLRDATVVQRKEDQSWLAESRKDKSVSKERGRLEEEIESAKK